MVGSGEGRQEAVKKLKERRLALYCTRRRSIVGGRILIQ